MGSESSKKTHDGFLVYVKAKLNKKQFEDQKTKNLKQIRNPEINYLLKSRLITNPTPISYNKNIWQM